MKKIFFVFLLPIVFMLVLFSNSKCFALERDLLPDFIVDAGVNNGFTYTDFATWDKADYYVIIKSSISNSYRFYYGSEKITASYVYDENSKNTNLSIIVPKQGVRCNIVSVDDSGHINNSVTGITGEHILYQSNGETQDFIASNYDVIKTGSNEVFFKPPQGILAPVVAQVTMGKVLQEILGILPIMIIILVGLIGLRKGLALLFRILRQS